MWTHVNEAMKQRESDISSDSCLTELFTVVVLAKLAVLCCSCTQFDFGHAVTAGLPDAVAAAAAAAAAARCRQREVTWLLLDQEEDAME